MPFVCNPVSKNEEHLEETIRKEKIKGKLIKLQILSPTANTYLIKHLEQALERSTEGNEKKKSKDPKET